jgi:hypothetical protein
MAYAFKIAFYLIWRFGQFGYLNSGWSVSGPQAWTLAAAKDNYGN